MRDQFSMMLLVMVVPVILFIAFSAWKHTVNAFVDDRFEALEARVTALEEAAP